MSNEPIAERIYRMILRCKHDFTKPGQFAQISVPGYFLRRPISVSDWGENWFSVVYAIVGEGTKSLAQMRPTDEADVLTGLGNGFDAYGRAIIIAGGMGAAPMLSLAKRLIRPDMALGFKSAAQSFYVEELSCLAANVSVATQDGTLGVKGLVTDILKGDYERVFVCGPEAMMRAVYKVYPDAFYSLEARMACGFGACMGCSVETRRGMKRVCHNGPVFFGGDLAW